MTNLKSSNVNQLLQIILDAAHAMQESLAHCLYCLRCLSLTQDCLDLTSVCLLPINYRLLCPIAFILLVIQEFASSDSEFKEAIQLLIARGQHLPVISHEREGLGRGRLISRQGLFFDIQQSQTKQFFCLTQQLILYQAMPFEQQRQHR